MNGKMNGQMEQPPNLPIIIPMNYEVALNTAQRIAADYASKNIQLQTNLDVLASRYQELMKLNLELEEKIAKLEGETVVEVESQLSLNIPANG